MTTRSRTVLAVVRLHLIVTSRAFGMPWILLAGVFAVNAGFGSVAAGRQVIVTGGLFALHVSLFVTAIQTVTRVLPLAVTLGVTRRDHLLGTWLFLAGQALGAGLVLGVLREIERGTGHWATGLHFFDLPYLVDGGPVAAAVGFAGSLAPVCAAGLLCGSVAHRWGAPGTTVLSAAAVTLPSLVLWWLARADAWRAVGDWSARQPHLVLQAALPGAVAVALAGLGYLTVRRAAV